MGKDRACIDCKLVAPNTNTAHTLISSEHGWRLTLRYDGRGEKVPEWRCPSCWRAYKKNRQTA